MIKRPITAQLRDDASSQGAMIAALKDQFIPALRNREFTGSFPHFRRLGKKKIDLITVQFDRHGGGFVLEIASCDPSGITTAWGQLIPPNKVKAGDLHPYERHRLGSTGRGVDGRWFRYDDGTPCAVIAQTATEYLREADSWWSSRG